MEAPKTATGLFPSLTTWETSQWTRHFRRSGRFPATSWGTAQPSFLGSRVGCFTGESVRNLTFMAPNASGPPRVPDPPVLTRAPSTAPARPPREVAQIPPTPGLAGGACVRARWAAHLMSTPRDSRGVSVFWFAPAPRHLRTPHPDPLRNSTPHLNAQPPNPDPLRSSTCAPKSGGATAGGRGRRPRRGPARSRRA